MKLGPNLHMTFINTFNIAFASCLFLVNLSSFPVQQPCYIYVNVSIHLPFLLKSNVSMVFENGMAGYIVIFITDTGTFHIA